LAILIVLRLSGVGTGGHWIPKHLPDEANRLHHPLRFSIVTPPDWVSEIASSEQSDEEYIATNPGSGRVRYHPQIRVRRLTQAPDLQGFSEATLGPYKAHRKLEIQIGGGDEPYLACEYVMSGRAASFSIVYLAPNGPCGEPHDNDVPIEIAQYLETFRYDLPAPGSEPSGENIHE